MIDTKKVWDALIENGYLQAILPATEMRAVLRDAVVEKIPEFMAEHLAKPVNGLSLMECWLAYSKQYRDADVFGKLVDAAPQGSEFDYAPDKRTEEAAASSKALEDSVLKLETAILQVKLGATNAGGAQERYALSMLSMLQLTGCDWSSMTIAQLLETNPHVLLRFG